MTETKNAIFNVENYVPVFKRELKTDGLVKYIDLINQFLIYANENIYIQNEKYFTYVLFQGIYALCSIFSMLLLYTKNLDITYYHSQKAYYYYTEFISQIGDENNGFLQLSSKDAILFIYRKTIYDISQEMRKESTLTDTENKIYIELLDNCKSINKICIMLINTYTSSTFTDKSEFYRKIIPKLNKIYEIIILSKNKESLFIISIDILERSLQMIKTISCIKLLKIIEVCIKKLENSKSIDLHSINKRLLHSKYEDVIEESIGKISSYLIQ